MAFSIMLVEDCPIFLDMTKRMLGQAGYLHIETYNDGCLAWDRIRKIGPPNLIITDNDMPRMSGMELSRLVLAKYSHVKIVMMTSCPETLQKKYCFKVIGKGKDNFYSELLKVVDGCKESCTNTLVNQL